MSWMILVTWLARLILLILIGMSVYVVSIILERRDFFKKNGLSEKNLGAKVHSTLQEIQGELAESCIFSTQLLNMKNHNGSLNRLRAKNELLFKKKEEGQLAVLGTFGATAPFIGLLGTVFGIIVAFGELSLGKVDTNSIMFALAEALILTAVGLVVAIPSVISFNYFSKKLKREREQVYLIQQIILEEKK